MKRLGARQSQSFREINSGEDCPRARPGFVKPIRNGLRMKQNWIERRFSPVYSSFWSLIPFSLHPGRFPPWMGERMELDSKKKSKCDRMRSKRFETQKVKREIGRKEAAESRGFPILWMGIMEDVFQMEGK